MPDYVCRACRQLLLRSVARRASGMAAKACLSLFLLLALYIVVCQAGSLQPLPVLPYVGVGFNAYDDSFGKAVIGNFTYGSGKTFTTYDAMGDSFTYLVPDEADAQYAPVFGVESFSYSSVTDLLEQEAINMGVAAELRKGFPLFGLSVNVENINTKIEESDAVYFTAKEYADVYSVRLHADSSLDSAFIQAVDDLPDTFGYPNATTLAPFEMFLGSYGTHVVVDVTAGGKAEVAAYASWAKRQTYSDLLIKMQATLLFFKFKFPEADLPYSSLDKDPSLSPTYGATVTDNLSLYGGDVIVDRNSPSWFADWIGTVPANPAVTRKRLMPIDRYIRLVDPSAASAYAEFMEYYSSLISPSYVTASEGPVVLGHGEISEPGACNVPLPDDDDGDDDDDGCALECPEDFPLWYFSTYHGDDGDADQCAIGYSSQHAYDAFGAKPSVNWAVTAFAGQPYDEVTEEVQSRSSPPLIPWMARSPHGSLESSAEDTIPGLSTLGVGFDVLTGDYRLQVQQWTYDDGNMWTAGDGQEFRYPDEAIVFVGSASEPPIRKLFSSRQEYASYQAEQSGFDVGLPGLFSLGREEEMVSAVFDGAQSQLALLDKFYTSYEMSVKQEGASADFAAVVASLPAEYDYEAYLAFLQFYGTHVVTSATFGGRVKLFSAVGQSYFMTHSADSIETSVEGHYNSFQAGLEWGTGSSTGAIDYSKETFGWLWMYGGSAATTLTSQWEQWVRSTAQVPTQTSNELTPIYNFITDPQKAAFVKEAMDEYVASAALVDGPTVDGNMQLSFAPIANATNNAFQSGSTFALAFKHNSFCSTLDSITATQNQTAVSAEYVGVTSGSYHPPPVQTLDTSTTVGTEDYVVQCPANTWVSAFGVKSWAYSAVACDNISGACMSSPVSCSAFGYYPSDGWME